MHGCAHLGQSSPVTDSTADRPPLDLDRLATPVDWSVEVVDATPSTNALVAERARSGAAGEGLVVVAEHQTAGRGRLDRTWETPARSALTMSLLLVPRAAAADWPWLPLLTGYAAARALRQLGAPSPSSGRTTCCSATASSPAS